MDVLDAVFGAGPVFDKYARLVRDSLDSSMALVSLVTADAQFMPGAVGMSEPWQTVRRVPLDRSVCHHVATTNDLFAVDDAEQPRPGMPAHPVAAMRMLGVRAYAGYPLRTPDGAAIGAVCAIDWRPRRWTALETETLRDIAGFCSTEIAYRQARADFVSPHENEIAST